MSRKVLAFTQPGCPACAEFKPIAKRVAAHYSSCVETKFVDVDTLAGNELANKLRVNAVPSVIVVDANGRAVARMIGYTNQPRLVQAYNKAIVGGTCAIEPFQEI
jgi:thioredoxin-like negative regulator of GroEL